MEFQVNVRATVKILTTSMPKCSYFMESAGAMHLRMQRNMQYVFHDVCHIQIITYFYGWWIVLEAQSAYLTRSWRSPPRTPDAVLQSFDDDGRSSIFEEPINILEELNDQIHEYA
jgi:hypothetical protein